MTTARNSYATLSEYNNYAKTRGVTAPTDTTDDAVIDMMLEAASRRYEDDHDHLQFYPTVATKNFDIPNWTSRGQLWFGETDSLVELLTLTNGDATTIAATEYDLLPANLYPKYGLAIKSGSDVDWEDDADGNTVQVIDVLGIWATHDRYTSDGWVLGSTLSEDLDTTELGFDLVSGTPFSAGQIIRIENEICIVSAVATNTVSTLLRGDNGSTAATHASGTAVKYWSPMTQVKEAVLEMVNVQYQARSQTSIGATNPKKRWQTEGSKV